MRHLSNAAHAVPPKRWTAFFASIFIAVLSFVIGSFVLGGGPSHAIQMPHNGVWR